MSTTRQRRARAELLALVVVSACAASAPMRWLAPIPPGDLRSSWVRSRIDEATVELVRALTREGADTLQRRRIRLGDDLGALSPLGRRRAESAMVGLRPRANERRWSLLRRLAGDRVVGWCARGVALHEPGDPGGLAQRALSVERLLVVLDGSRGRWGLWLEGLVLDGVLWRWLPWVGWTDAVEAPRSAHTDIEMWSCEIERAVSGSGSPVR